MKSKAMLYLLLVGVVAVGIMAMDRITVDRPSGSPEVNSYATLPLRFEATEGGQTRFLARGSDYSVFLTPNEAVVVLSSAVSDTEEESVDQGAKRTAAVRVELVGADADAGVGELAALPAKVNYFLGADPSQWRVNVPTYERVRFRDVYPGVDVAYYGNQGQLEYDFIVGPEADPEAVALDFKGVDGIELGSNGDLLLETEGGTVRQHKPVIYQQVNGARVEVPGGYILGDDNRVAFEIGAYDESQPLFIDPVLSYSTYLGGSGRDLITGVTVDRFGNVYLLGQTRSIDFPTVNPVQNENAGGLRDVTVTKLNRQGTAVLFSTYLGGSDLDVSEGFDVDYWGNVYIAGQTSSSDFPLVRPMQASYGGGIRDGFVAKLDASGSVLHYSTYLGASDEDGATQIKVDLFGAVYVGGATFSSDFPTVNALQSEHGGMFDIFLAKLNRDGSALQFSTFLGGSGGESAFGLDRDFWGHIYLVGFTNSVDFPTTAGAFQTSFGGMGDDVWGDGFVVKLDRRASTLMYSTYLGGSDSDRPLSLEVDLLGQVYVAGSTNSPDFPTTPGAFQTTFGGGDGDIVKGDAFVTKLNRGGSDLIYSTYLGGSGDDGANEIVIDGGRAYATGFTASDDFPTTENALQPEFAGSGDCTAGGVTRICRDAFVTVLNRRGEALGFSTYLGGTGDDHAAGIALGWRTFRSYPGLRFVLRPVSLYVAGSTSSMDFPTANPYQPTNAGDFDQFVAKLVLSTPGW